MSAAALGVRLWFRTLKIQWSPETPSVHEGIIVLWHESLLLGLYAFRHRQLGILMSKSRDGDWGATLSRQWGYRVFRGSSSRGGFQIAQLARYLKYRRENNLSALGGMALDGPIGPYRYPQAGSLWLSKKTGLPVFTLTALPSAYHRMKNWDETIIPLPFSKIRLTLTPVRFPQSSEVIAKSLNYHGA